MPPSQSLQWIKIEEFGSLWTDGDKLLMPPNAAQRMSGCHPQPQGGLRAFHRPGFRYDSEGLPQSSTPCLVLAAYDIDGTPFIFTVDVGDDNNPSVVDLLPGDNCRLWYLDSSGWVEAAADLAGEDNDGGVPLSSVAGVQAVSAATSATTDYYVTIPGPDFHFGEGVGTSTGGVYLLEPDGTATNMDFDDLTPPGQILIHQSRLVVGIKSSIVFSSPGVYDLGTNPGTSDNFINFGAGNVAWVVSVPPSDLIVGTEDGGIFAVQGDLADPVIRTLATNTGLNHYHQPALSPHGPVVQLPAGISLLGSDGAQQNLSPSIDPRIWEDGGEIIWSGDYLFCPNRHTGDDLLSNGSLVYDFRTRAWFTAAHPDAATAPNPITHQFTVRTSPEIVSFPYASIGGIQTTIAHSYRPFDIDEGRSHVWEWTSAPLHTPDGREVDLREVQFGALAQPLPTGPGPATMGSTVTVTATSNDGTTSSATVDVAPGKGLYTVPLRCRGTYVEVTIKAKNLDGTDSSGTNSEAPMLEYVAFGWRPGHIRRQKQLGGFSTAYAAGY